MSIRYIQALSKKDATKFIQGHHALSSPLTRQFQDRVAWIGIDDYGHSPVAEVKTPHLVLRFIDAPDDTYTEAIQPEHAQNIVEFVRRLEKSRDPWALLVHCHAGVSRSGAVAEWVEEKYAPLPRVMFDELHSHCLPNQYVLRLLNEYDLSSGSGLRGPNEAGRESP